MGLEMSLWNAHLVYRGIVRDIHTSPKSNKHKFAWLTWYFYANFGFLALVSVWAMVLDCEKVISEA